MELLYIWVEKYGCFENREFLFNQNYDISFLKNVLYIKKLRDKVLLYESPIANINVVAGKNGTGKSCLMELVQDISKINIEDTNRLSYFSNIKAKVIFVFESNEVIEIYSNMLSEMTISDIKQSQNIAFDLSDIAFETKGSIFENKLSNKCQVIRFNNLINFNSGFSQVSKTPIEKLDPVEHELNQTDYRTTVNNVHAMLQDVFY